LPGVTGTETSIVVFRGELILGGDLVVSGATAGVAKWNGSAWIRLDPSGKSLRTVRSLTVHNDTLIAGGAFSNSSGPRLIAEWDGTTWSQIGPNLPGIVDSVCSHDGNLYAAGYTGKFVHKWNGSTWTPMQGELNEGVDRLVSHAGVLIASGGPFNLSGVPRYLAYWDGAHWLALPGVPRRAPRALVSHEGVLYTGGVASSPNGLAVDFLSAWDWLDWIPIGVETPGVDFAWSDRVDALTVWNGKLVVCGKFGTVDGTTLNNVSIIDNDTWTTVGEGLSGPGLTGFAVHNGELYAYGGIDAAGGVPADGFARWNGTHWVGIGDGTFTYGYAAASFDDELIVAGRTPGQTPRTMFAARTPSGWAELLGSSGSLNAGQVNTLFVFQGTLIAGGAFVLPGGNPVFPSDPIAVWDGTTWSGALGNTQLERVTAGVRKFVVHEGQLFGIGDFTGLVAVADSANIVAKWDGAAWIPVPLENPGADSILDIELFQNNLIASRKYGSLVRLEGEKWVDVDSTSKGANRLTTFEGALYTGSAPLLRLDGSGWIPQGTFSSGTISALFEYAGDLFAGGAFDRVDSQPSFKWARRSPSGLPWLDEHPTSVGTTKNTNVAFSVVPHTPFGFGGEPTYQWRRNGIPLTDGPGKASPNGGTVGGSTTPTLTIQSVQMSDAGNFDVVTHNECGNITSMNATLRVGQIEPCSGDLDGDGATNTTDFTIFVAHFGSGPGATASQGDLNGDGRVNAKDFNILAHDFGCISLN